MRLFSTMKALSLSMIGKSTRGQAMGLLLVTGFLGIENAQAFEEGKYLCRETEGLPASEYTLTKVKTSDSNIELPHVQVIRFRRYENSNGETEIRQYNIKGIAMHSEIVGVSESFMLGSLLLELKDGRMTGCQKQ